jgi:hypothetical protein
MEWSRCTSQETTRKAMPRNIGAGTNTKYVQNVHSSESHATPTGPRPLFGRGGRTYRSIIFSGVSISSNIYEALDSNIESFCPAHSSPRSAHQSLELLGLIVSYLRRRTAWRWTGRKWQLPPPTEGVWSSKRFISYSSPLTKDARGTCRRARWTLTVQLRMLLLRVAASPCLSTSATTRC